MIPNWKEQWICCGQCYHTEEPRQAGGMGQEEPYEIQQGQMQSSCHLGMLSPSINTCWGVTGFTARALESPGRQHMACAGECTARNLWEGIMLLLGTCQITSRHCVLLRPSRKGNEKLPLAKFSWDSPEWLESDPCEKEIKELDLCILEKRWLQVNLIAACWHLWGYLQKDKASGKLSSGRTKNSKHKLKQEHSAWE